MADEGRSPDEVQTTAADIDLKVADVATLFQTTPQTVNRWVREILAKHNLELGYYIQATRWLRPEDINTIRAYREGTLEQGEEQEVQANGDRVSEVADEAFQGFAKITSRIDQQLNRALDARDRYVANRGRLVAEVFNPDAIAADILRAAAEGISGEGAEDLGEVATGAMVQPFRRTQGNLLNGTYPGQRRSLGGQSSKG